MKASQHSGVWLAVAAFCRAARAVSRRRALWSYRVGYAWERGGRWDEAGTAFTDACRLAPGLTYELPDPPQQWDRQSVRFARQLAFQGVKHQREGVVRGLFRRRSRVVPVVTGRTRRRWRHAAAHDQGALLHLLYLHHRDAVLPRTFARYERHGMPRNRLARAVRWYVGDVLVQSVRLVRHNGRYIRDTAGVPRLRQLRQMVRLAVSLPAMPENYYRYEWYRPDNQRRAGQYLHGHENSPVLYEMLSDIEQVAQAAPLADKVAFATRAHARGLPVVSTLAVVEHGQVVAAQPLPRADLFVKPLAGKRGVGAQKWRYEPADDRYARDGETVARDRFVEWLAGESVGQALLVQPCLDNHPDLAELALDALVTCRVITMTNERGAAEPVIATFRMPAVRDAVVDNMHRGGIAAPVLLDSGELGAATDYAVAGPAVRHPHHPVSGALIEGRTLPLWQQVRELVCRAHDSFHPRLLIGWDVTIGPDGPVLLEGNERPGVGGLQRLHDVPLGAHRFGELMAHHLVARYGMPD